jgi:hypothetical protein
MKKGDGNMKKIIILAILVMTTIFNCTERDLMIMREADREMNERGRECRHNKRDGLESCRFIN